MRKEEKAVLWAERIQEFRSSGLTCKQWCTEHEISLSTMGYWLRKSETKEPKMETEPVFAKLPSEKEIAANMVSVLPSAFQIPPRPTLRPPMPPTPSPHWRDSGCNAYPRRRMSARSVAPRRTPRSRTPPRGPV